MTATALLRVLLLLSGTLVLHGAPQRAGARPQSVRIRVQSRGDSIVMTFVSSSPDVKLEGFILGYGSSSSSRQLIPLGGRGYEAELELDAEPTYLVSVQQSPAHQIQELCTGKLELEKPLQVVLVSVRPSAVLLSWGESLKTPSEGNGTGECLEDGFYTIRYRERNRKWRYQTCPTSATVVERLKPHTTYEFGVRSNKGDRTGTWSRPTIHSTSMGNKNTPKTYKSRNTLKPHAVFPPPANESSVFQQPSPPPGPAQPTTTDRDRTTTGAATARRQETWEDSALFQPRPASPVDAVGNKRFVAPHVVYQTGKRPGEPCSITSSLNYFPVDGAGVADVAAPPKSPPSNLTVVTVEGCPSFVILDWENSDQDTTEYDVISTAKGPDGEQVSILTTNRTHTTVENLRPESSYEFTVKPKNQLGAGPPSGPVAFHTESADPRVSENVSGRASLWTRFPFEVDRFSACRGPQYVKRTWYRKFVGVQLCNSLRYQIYLSDSLSGKFHNIGDQTGFGEDHCQFVDSLLDGRTGRRLRADQLPSRPGFYRAERQEPVLFGPMGGRSHVNYVSWYECGTPIPGKW